MIFAVTGTAYLRPTPAADAIFASCVGAAGAICVNVRRLDPFPTGADGAVDPVLGGVFHVLFVPFFLEGCVKQFCYFCRIDWLGACTASRGHMLRVSEGEVEKAADAGVAHIMRAR